jgi:hypothetical protein
MRSELARRARGAVLVVVEYAGNGAYGLVHPSLLRGGALASERRRPLPGDELVPEPNWQATRAETIRAPAAAVWPWLVQLGYGRGGYYGDLPWWYGERGRGVDASAELCSSRTLDGREVDPAAEPKPRPYFDCSWAFVLVPDGEALTRLLVRGRLRMVSGWALHAAGFLMLGDTVMQWAMLRGIKRRVEQASHQTAATGAFQ